MYENDKVTISVMLYNHHCKVCNSPYRLIYESMSQSGMSNEKITELANNHFNDYFSSMSFGRHLKKHTKIQKKVYLKPKEQSYENIIDQCDELLAYSLQHFPMDFIRKFHNKWMEKMKKVEDRLFWTKKTLYDEVTDVIKSIDPSKLQRFKEMYEQWFEYNKA